MGWYTETAFERVVAVMLLPALASSPPNKLCDRRLRAWAKLGCLGALVADAAETIRQGQIAQW